MTKNEKIRELLYSPIIQNKNMGRIGTTQISNSSSVTTGIYAYGNQKVWCWMVGWMGEWIDGWMVNC